MMIANQVRVARVIRKVRVAESENLLNRGNTLEVTVGGAGLPERFAAELESLRFSYVRRYSAGTNASRSGAATVRPGRWGGLGGNPSWQRKGWIHAEEPGMRTTDQGPAR
jgi:hypothetical protein